MAKLTELKRISAEDRRMLQDVEAMMGPEPEELGFIKNLFWGRIREDLVFPYPEQDPEEEARCEALLKELDAYLRNEHPSIYIDQNEEIPDWVFKRLFEMGIMGLTIPEEYGGLGLGVTSYNRVIERIGQTCAATSVVVSAHQSIGCKAIMLFGTEEQKKRWLPLVARECLSAFCLSEPNVGSDAGGIETTCELSEDGKYYILNGEKKWTTSGAMSCVFTVMARQKYVDPRTGKEKEGITALVCTPDMEGIDIYEKNRSKCGIRGTWQARIRFNNVKVPVENRLGKEGQGLKIALTCLNYGRCTLSAGILGGAKWSMNQSTKWALTRYQFGRPLASFELVRKRIARMAALTYAIDAVLYMVTGMLDRQDPDIMVETAAAKVFASEMGWQVIDDAMQIMGGEGYMTENELERVFRDGRIYRIVEGANEVMQSFIFGYGGKQLAEYMLTIQEVVGWDPDETPQENLSRIARNLLNPVVLRRAIPLGIELMLGIKPPRPSIERVHPMLRHLADRLERLVQDHTHQFKKVSMRFKEDIIQRQAVQARLADNAMYLFAMSCVLAKLDKQYREGASGIEFERDRAAGEHFFDLAELAIRRNTRELKENADRSMLVAAEAAIQYNATLPNSDFYLPEKSPVVKPGEGKPREKRWIKQFPGDAYAGEKVTDTAS